MKTLIALILLLGPSFAEAATLWLGTNQVTLGKVVEFVAPLNAKTRSEGSRVQRKADFVKGALVLPEKFDLRKLCPILIVSVPSSGSSIASLGRYTNVALSEGWAVLAVDGPKVRIEEDTIQWGWTTLSMPLRLCLSNATASHQIDYENPHFHSR